ncbi:alanine--tRNA ligase [Aliifodinibius sp. S!AR15-10]|uniref:alanine--tRNA ligase n=1 Tax=Aliifodinibius sp. S!AR15-10 TaxID=2950437 RepID=UPI00285E59DA|nr:alanine--tRNA ligase [Aliifodinibius sp. S!AR15-10]MDR8390865.1 alanine--tRNA ligase [Aliifodinibius sp. S!AR15-10]
MPVKSASQIRNEFFEFFEEKEHIIVDSAPVVPQDDPTLLFTNAGMNQFKPIFMGEESGYKSDGKVWKRAADTQRCIRVSGKHNDLEEVGHDTYHHTLFEMLGNWSFGDYFKEEAIEWAWELLVERWGLEPDRLYATVFGGDEEDGLPVDVEAIELWEKKTAINPEHILKFGKKDNFWEMGDTGPCGPCSEVHIDLRPDEERSKKDGAELVNMDDPRVMEIWNLVFIQFNRQPSGELEKLPAQHVDTGMGFERICAVLQGKRSNYDTDLFGPLLNKIGELADVTYGEDEEIDIAMRVIADHIRAVSFSIADGASPSNDGRGYVIRRILRRAIRYGWDKLDLKEPFFHKLVPTLADQFEEVFPVLIKQQDYVTNVIRAEEKSFLNTLGQGIELFNEMIDGKELLPGEDAFKLHDTYGFPIDLTELMARERGVEVDVEEFNKLMQEQKERSRAASNFKSPATATVSVTGEISANAKAYVGTKFVGYDELVTESKIVGSGSENDKQYIILDKTPFYAESGGQVADTGIISSGDEHLRVHDVQKQQDRFVHYVDSLPENPEGTWQALVDRERRREIRKHHTATHLVHAALRKVLGTHVAQKGSLVDPEHLRFDFSHYEQVTPEELKEIEKLVNDKIQENIPKQEERSVPIDEAKQRGAMMLFGEKYGDQVRVITFDQDYSVELCGGTHAEATGELGYLRFLGESSAAAGIRRVEAVVGQQADYLLREEKNLVQSIRSEIGQSENLVKDIRDLIEERKQLEKELERLKKQQSSGKLDQLISSAEQISGGIKLVSGEIEDADMDLLKQLGYESLEKSKTGTVTVLGSKHEDEGKVYIAATVTDDLIKEKNLKAGDLVGELGKMLGGGGGGQPSIATAGGRKTQKLGQVLQNLEKVVNSYLE